MPQVLEKHGLRDRVERMAVLEEWPALVGEQLAGVTKGRGVEDGTLFVEVRSSAWLMELSMMREAFLHRVNSGLGEAVLEKVVFVLAETS